MSREVLKRFSAANIQGTTAAHKRKKKGEKSTLLGIRARASVPRSSPEVTTAHYISTIRPQFVQTYHPPSQSHTPPPQLKHHLEGFLEGSRGAFLEAGVHEGGVGLHAGLDMHALEHPASGGEVPSPGTCCQQAGVALRCRLQPASLQLPKHLQRCLMICHLQSIAYL